jgi:cell division protein FtsL
MLLLAAGLAVLYISNAIAVNSLMADITSIERECDAARNENERLRAELLRLMSVERVTSIASQKLGMVQPATPPVTLKVEGGAVAEDNSQQKEETR